jgi:hypothetical protein
VALSVEAEGSPAAFEGSIVDRSIGRGGPGVQGPAAQSARRAKSNPEVNASFDGINLFQHRYADNQNQLTIEPPDQGLCAGNGYVFEAVTTRSACTTRAGIRCCRRARTRRPSRTSTAV